MKNQALFSSKDETKKLKCRLLQFLFGTLRVKICFANSSVHIYDLIESFHWCAIIYFHIGFSKLVLISNHDGHVSSFSFFTYKLKKRETYVLSKKENLIVYNLSIYD